MDRLQSGVMCKEFMFGSHVIATKIGLFPDYVDGKNGILLNRNVNVEEIYKAYCKIRQEQEAFSKCARATCLREFYYEAYIETLNKAILKAQAARNVNSAENKA